MKTITTTVIALLIHISFGQTTANLNWVQTFGNTDDETAQFVTTDDSGNIYTLGHYFGTVDINPGSGSLLLTSKGLEDFYVQKRDPQGNFLWGFGMGGVDYDAALGLAFDQDQNPIITGYFKGTIDFDPGPDTATLTSYDRNAFVLKLSPNGSFKWVRQIRTTEQTIGFNQGTSIATDKKGNSYVIGHFYGETYFDPIDTTSLITGEFFYGDAFISKYDSSGNFIWVKVFDGIFTDHGRSVAIDDFGNIYSCGYFGHSIDLDPGPQEYIISTTYPIDGYISKLDSNGNFVWGKHIKCTGELGFDEIDIWNNASIYVSGWFEGSAYISGNTATITSTGDEDGLIIKLNSSGSYEWHCHLSNLNRSLISSIDVDNGNNVYATGYFPGKSFIIDGQGINHTLNSNGGDDIFTFRLNHAGGLVWLTTMGSSFDDYTRSIHVNKFNEVYVAGHFQATVDFDPSSTQVNKTSNGGQDVFLQKLGQPLLNLPSISPFPEVRFFPNPTSDYLNIETDREVEFLSYELTDTKGMTLDKGIFYTSTSRLDLRNYPSGTYFLSIQQGYKSVIQKIVRE